MDPFLIVLIGIVIVVGGVLALRLPAFLTLTAGALAVGILTPRETIETYFQQQSALTVTQIDQDTVTLRSGTSQGTVEGATIYFLPNDRSQERQQLVVTQAEAGQSVARFQSTVPEDPRNGIYVTPSGLVAAKKRSAQTVGERVAEAFGSTCGKIGILIAMASIVGKCLLASGSADRIVRASLKLFGEARAALSFVLSSFTLGIPVFFDTVFYLMIPLGKAMTLRTGKNYLLYVLAITAGGTMAHSLVPPTPGPLFVAEELNVEMGMMILGGCVVGLFTSTTGYLWAQWINRRVEIPLRESADLSLAELQDLADRKEEDLPSIFEALLPILLPVLLIAGNTILDYLAGGSSSGTMYQLFRISELIGNKNIALVLAAAVALITLVRQTRPNREQLSANLQSALSGAGMIILITAAGGAFGAMLQETGIGHRIKSMADTYEISQLWVLALAWLVTTMVRTAQGSATVAMITSVGIVGGLADPSRLGYHPVYLALAIGCGSKPLAWMNDSGFWVICKMSGMTEAETLKVLTPMTAVMGVVGLVVTLIGAAFFPLT